MATTSDTRTLRIAVRDVSHAIRGLGVGCASLITTRPSPCPELERPDPRRSQLDRLLSEAHPSSGTVYHRTLVRRI